MMYDALDLTQAKIKANRTGPIIRENRPICMRCQQRKPTAGGKRIRDQFGRLKYICKECK